MDVAPGTDALTYVLGKERGGSVRGVGGGISSKRYREVCYTKGSTKKDIIADLQFENHKRDLECDQLKDTLKKLLTEQAELNDKRNQDAAMIR